MAQVETHIGDGVFVSYDGWTFKLRAPHEHGDHVVYLGRRELDVLNAYVKEVTAPCPSEIAATHA